MHVDSGSLHTKYVAAAQYTVRAAFLYRGRDQGEYRLLSMALVILAVYYFDMEQQDDPKQRGPLSVEEMKELMDHMMDKSFKYSIRVFLFIVPMMIVIMLLMFGFIMLLTR